MVADHDDLLLIDIWLLVFGRGGSARAGVLVLGQRAAFSAVGRGVEVHWGGVQGDHP